MLLGHNGIEGFKATLCGEPSLCTGPSVPPASEAALNHGALGFAKRPAQLKAAMADVLENAEADLTPMVRNLINTLWDEWKTVEQQTGSSVRNWNGSPLPMPAVRASGRSRRRTGRCYSDRCRDRRRCCVPQGTGLCGMTGCQGSHERRRGGHG